MINQSEMGGGMTLIDAGHFGTEKFAANLFAKLLTERLNGGDV